MAKHQAVPTILSEGADIIMPVTGPSAGAPS